MTDAFTTPSPASPEPLPLAETKAGSLPVPQQPPGEIGGPRGPEPTRFGDWEFKGRCSDF